MRQEILLLCICAGLGSMIGCHRNMPNGISVKQPIGPLSGVKNIADDFYSSATNQDGEEVAIRFDWGDGNISDWSGYVASESVVVLSHAYATARIYSVRAQARDAQGDSSIWSDARQVFIADSTPGVIKWRYQTGDRISSSPAMGSDGTIYVGSDDNYFYAVNSDGTLQWRYLLNEDVDSSPAIGEDGTIYFGLDSGYVYALNPDGSLKWRYQTSFNWPGDPSSPVVGPDGTIYVGSNDGRLSALNLDGTLKWSYQMAGHCTTPAIGRYGTIYVGSNNGSVYALNSDGTLQWRFIEDSSSVSTFTSLVLDADGSIHALYRYLNDTYIFALYANGMLKWYSRLNGGSGDSQIAISDDGTIYVGSSDGYLNALNANGNLKWRYYTGYYVYGSPAISTDETIVIGSFDRYFYAINTDGSLKWRADIGQQIRSSPVIDSAGIIYFGADDGCLYAIYGTGQLADAPWSMFHHDIKHTCRQGGGR